MAKAFRFVAMVFGIVLALTSVVLQCDATTAPLSKDDATLTSDEMDLIDNGHQSVFIGHVLLQKTAYELKADRMTRAQATGLVEASGHIKGTWHNPAGGTLIAEGDKAKYDPATQTAQLWTNPGKQVSMTWTDNHGSGHFLSDRALLYMDPKHVQLVDHVTGHIIPAAKQ